MPTRFFLAVTLLCSVPAAGCDPAPPPKSSPTAWTVATGAARLSGIGIRPLVIDAGFAVGEVFHGSAAERAGLQVGDAVTAVDGQPSAHWSLEQVTDRLRGPPGSAVTLEVQRGGVSRRIVIVRAVLDHTPP